jgi:hypothetical protein
MHVDVNGTRLWFVVDEPALVPDGPQMVHGGPGRAESGSGAERSRRRDVTLPSGRVDLVDEHRRRRGRLGGSM